MWSCTGGRRRGKVVGVHIVPLDGTGGGRDKVGGSIR